MYNVDGPNISPSETVDITPEEGQIPVSFNLVPNWEALVFPKDYSLGRRYFNEERKLPITPQNSLLLKTLEVFPPTFTICSWIFLLILCSLECTHSF